VTRAASYAQNARVRVKDKVPLFKGAVGRVVVATHAPGQGMDVIVDIPGEGPLHFAGHELEVLPEEVAS
jgi:hypothetical protein